MRFFLLVSFLNAWKSGNINAFGWACVQGFLVGPDPGGGGGGGEGAKQKEKDWLEEWPVQKLSSAEGLMKIVNGLPVQPAQPVCHPTLFLVASDTQYVTLYCISRRRVSNDGLFLKINFSSNSALTSCV